ncbi:polysaccharide deacetylase family protein [Sphaerisporangium corydalis]|uniref:Polysaccharide deacetylase family protein n=1 Tax=Sphaerisporangium corydalis TaxID=1441875 RepID=A0ABV9EU65_9ACTN|nr:polysaccharide deacetylase family protein [Sphaerisporangium corydalis]
MTLSVSRYAVVTLMALLALTACGGQDAQRDGNAPGVANDSPPAFRGGNAPGITRTIVALTFDDAWATQVIAGELLRAHHLVGTFYINSGFLGRPKRLTRAQVDTLAAAGNEIGGHTLTHSRLPTLSLAAKRRQICGDRRALMAMGYRPRSFAYPYGMFDAATVAVVRRCGYDSARRSGGLAPPSDPCPLCGRSEDLRVTDAYHLRTMPAVRRSVTLATLKDYVLEAEKRGGGLVTYQFHNVCDTCDEFGVRPKVLDAFLGWVAGSGARVRLFGDIVGGALHPVPKRP